MDPTVANSLLCCENVSMGAERLCKAYRDPALARDARVLRNLLVSEARYLPTCSGFKCARSEIKVPMRRELAYWMVEVCEEQSCQDDVFPLSMNLVDRFLGVTALKKEHLQLLGAVCLFISSKLRESAPLTAAILAQCADHSFTCQDVKDWELLVLHRLRWEVSAVTSHDFLDPLLERLPLQAHLPPTGLLDIRRQAQTFLIMCVAEYKFTVYTASVVASACLAAAVRGALPERTAPAAAAACLSRLHQVTDVETELLQRCMDDIEQTIREFAAEQASRPARPSRPVNLPPDELGADYSEAGTPTDVREVHF